MAKQQDSYLIIGGCGFLGRHIVEQLLARGERSVAVFDLAQRHFDPEVQFFTGDICNETEIRNAITKSQATCIIHTASPIMNFLTKPEVYWRVNVDGTKNILEVARAHGVKKLVYTSSASVVMTSDQVIIDVDERLPFSEKPVDEYTRTKAEAERIVLAENGKDGLLTVALRPAGIFGPGDRQMIYGIEQAIAGGQSHIQMGNNLNLFDYTYVGNVAKAHLLAADKLSNPPLDHDDVSIPLCSLDITVGERRIPTSEARPLGPAITPVPNATQIEQEFSLPRSTEERPVLRTRFDQFSEAALKREEGIMNPLQVAGQAFFITNGEPVYWWDFIRAVQAEMGHFAPKKTLAIPKSIAWYLGAGAECWRWLTHRPVTFDTFRVLVMTTDRWYNIERARRVLGYEPDVGLQEGIKRYVAWWMEHKKNLPQNGEKR